MGEVNILLIAAGIFILAVEREYIKRKKLNGIKSFIIGFVTIQIMLISLSVSNYFIYRPELNMQSDWLLLSGIFIVGPLIVSTGFYQIGIKSEFLD